MALHSLKIANFRNFNSAELQFISPGFNVIYGCNGSGKTSLLESIYYLSLGRSFRSQVTRHIIQYSADCFSIFAHILAPGSEQKTPIGLERHQSGSLKARIAGKDARALSELANLMPLQLINTDCYNLLEGGPAFRRKYLDWGTFYQNAEFLRIWRHFERALKQRNAALRGLVSKKELQGWSAELIQTAELLHQYRFEYATRLQPYLTATVRELLIHYNIQIIYQRGWSEAVDFSAALHASYEKDRYLGYTTVGPHRADFTMTIDQMAAKDILSRGQQKLFVCAMIVAQGALLHDCSQKRLVYLVDDLPSELDSTSRGNLVALLAKQQAQIFVTTIESDTLKDALAAVPVKMFHVKHNGVAEEAAYYCVSSDEQKFNQY